MPAGVSRQLAKFSAIWGFRIQLFSSVWKGLGKFMKYDDIRINQLNH
jgi:hypothetical protein